jgi:hypothetical protein
MANEDFSFLQRTVIQDLIRKNITVLRRLYDHYRGAFNSRIYVKNLSEILQDNLQIPYARHLLKIALPQLVALGQKRTRIDTVIDLKYHGHACVGLSKYILETDNKDSHLFDMMRSSLDYLMHHQSGSGPLVCKFVRGSKINYGTDIRSITESSEAFLWALAASLELYRNDEQYLRILSGRAERVANWMMRNNKSLSPQETGRLIYGLAELYVATRGAKYISWITSLANSLVSQLRNLTSFGLFSQDIDTIGGLSVASHMTGKVFFLKIATRLVHNQLINQGPNGEWRWSFNKWNGEHSLFKDITYSVHQLGMAPWGFSQYLLGSNLDHMSNLYERVVKGILWIVKKRAFTDEFIVRSYSGLTGNIYELEQRSYEPGLNILGLLSYGSLTGFHTREFPLGQL